MKLATKLSFFFILLSIIPLTVVGYIAYFNGKQTIVQQTYDHVLAISSLKESEFNRWVNDNTRRLRGLAQRPSVRNYISVLARSGTNPDDPEYQDAYSRLLENHLIPAIEEAGGFLDLFILRVDNGLIMVATEKDHEGKFRDDQKFFLEGKSQAYVDGVIFNLSEGEYHMHFSTPVLDGGGSTIAVLVGHADLGDMATIIEQHSGVIAIEDSYLVNAYNFFVTNPLNGEEYALKKAVYTDGVEACLAGDSGTGIYEDYRGKTVLGAYRWMPDYRMCLLTEVDQSEAFTPVESLRLSVVGFGVAVAMFVVLLSLLFAHTITDPLRQLVESAREVGRGNLDYRLKIEGKDEISTLARAFNQMTENLQLITASRDELDSEIIERKKAEEQALKERDKAQQYLDVAGTIFVVIDADQTVSLVNQAGCKMLGAEEDEIVGKNWFDTFIPERNRRDVIAVFNLLMAGEMVPIEYYENPVLVKDGSERIIAWHNTLLFDEEGVIRGALSSGEDITERKEAELEIQKLNEELERRVLLRTAQLEASNMELEAFAYSVSHDLRAPLRAIEGFSRILMDEHRPSLSPEAQRYLGLVRNNALDMDKLIDDLLAFSRLARQELATKRVSPKEIVNLALKELESALEGRAVELTIADLPDCKADPALLKLVYINLLENAIKFTRGKDPATVEIGFIDLDDENVYFVKDNGVGFDMQYADKLFGVFQRLHRAEDFEGTGVGLANVQRIISRHGGRVWAEAEVDQGATFYFTCEGEIQDD